MKLASIRLGFATNSSSQHSIIVGGHGYPEHDCDDGDDFGWDAFVLYTPQAKAAYFAAQLYNQLTAEMAEPEARKVLTSICGMPVPQQIRSVDHQSSWRYVGWHPGSGKTGLNQDFYAALGSRIIRGKDAVIIGGNDNDGDGLDAHSVSGGKDLTSILSRYTDVIARPDGDWWTLFDADHGTKIRLTFNDDAAPYLASTAPELVDLKITNQCHHKCAFCYQNSTPDGKHAALDDVIAILDALAKAQVFEIAIGGGDVLCHPDLGEILKQCRGRGIVPNITFRDTQWSDVPAVVDAVNAHCGGLAVSAIDMTNLVRLNTESNDRRYRGPRRISQTLQIPLGCYPEADVIDAIAFACDHWIPVTLLGYKDTGRGHGFKAYPYDGVMAYVLQRFELIRHQERDDASPHRRKDYPEPVDARSQTWQPLSWAGVGMDTLLVEQYRKQLDDAGVSEKLRVGREGMFSMYIDAVTMTMAASSYSGNGCGFTAADLPEKLKNWRQYA